MHKYTALSVLAICAAAFGAYPSGASAAEGHDDTPAELVDSLHQAFGNNHARAVHAKGVMLEGDFRADAAARTLSSSPLFSGATVPVLARFSDFTGLPEIPDAAAEANPRGFAVKFKLADGASMDIVAHSFNGFPVATANEFGQLMRALGGSGPTAAKPTPLDRFLDAHPIAKTFLTSQKPSPASYGTLGYFGVNSFQFTGADGSHRFVRYRFVPVAGEKLLDAKSLASKTPKYLAEEIAERVAKAPVRFDWYAQIAESGDVIDDPSRAWPDSRKLVKLGTISLSKVFPAATAPDKQTLFLPNNLTAGIAPADPMITARSQSYPISFSQRQ